MVTGRLGTSTKPSVPLPSHDPGAVSTQISTVCGISNSMKNLTLADPMAAVMPATRSFDTVYRAGSWSGFHHVHAVPTCVQVGSAPNVAESVT